MPSIYFAHEREVFERDGMLLAVSECSQPATDEERSPSSVRYRTVGDMTVTGAVRSDAADVEDVVPRPPPRAMTERGATRADDRVVGGRHGGPQARGLLLMPRADRPAAHRHRGLGRRRQVDADRPAAARHQGAPRRPARRVAPPRRATALDLAHVTDGLRAEREQGITIDVAYRYFATPRRSFILADTPGHVRYTRNMVTGASTADLALVLIDARRASSSSRAATRTWPRCSASATSWSA